MHGYLKSIFMSGYFWKFKMFKNQQFLRKDILLVISGTWVPLWYYWLGDVSILDNFYFSLLKFT